MLHFIAKSLMTLWIYKVFFFFSLAIYFLKTPGHWSLAISSLPSGVSWWHHGAAV